VGSATVPK